MRFAQESKDNSYSRSEIVSYSVGIIYAFSEKILFEKIRLDFIGKLCYNQKYKTGKKMNERRFYSMNKDFFKGLAVGVGIAGLAAVAATAAVKALKGCCCGDCDDDFEYECCCGDCDDDTDYMDAPVGDNTEENEEEDSSEQEETDGE